MSDELHEAAYAVALKHHRALGRKVFRSLAFRFRRDGRDAVYRAATRGVQLRLASLEFAGKVLGQGYPYEKALESLRRQFSEFPVPTVDRALSDAWTEEIR